MKTPLLIVLTLLSLSLKAQKDTTFQRAFSLTTTATFPDPSSGDFKEIKQNVTLRLLGKVFTITRLGTSTFLGSSDTLNVKKVSYSKDANCLTITTKEGYEISGYDLSVFVKYPVENKRYRMDLMEAKDEVKVKGKVTIVPSH